MRSIFRRALFAPKSRKNRRRRDKGQVTHRLEQLEVRRNLAHILDGTGEGVDPTRGVTRDLHWDIVALPASATSYTEEGSIPAWVHTS